LKRNARRYLNRIKHSAGARLWRIQQRAHISKYQQNLNEILIQNSRASQVIIFPPGLGWHTHLFQRPQQLAQALSVAGALVFYVEPEHSGTESGFRKQKNNLFLCHVPLETFALLPRPLVHSITWNYKFTSRFVRPRIIYDFVDHLKVFQGNQKVLQSQHERLLSEAVLVLATAQILYEEVRTTRPDALLCPNAVDFDHFSRAAGKAGLKAPEDLQPALADNRKLVGYYGALASWFDFELVRKTAQARPEYSFVLIGPEIDSSLRDSGIINLPNIFVLGEKSYLELPEYLRFFDCAIIPFCLNEITHATSPVKMFEYMAAGKPVVATAMQESMRYPLILISQNADNFIQQIDHALELTMDETYPQSLQEMARQNTWEKRAQQIMSALNEIDHRKINLV
jgi:glycosyltransferase involved in cell wall biosynthesis